MIDRDTQLKIQAFTDGELAESEAREITALIARDREAAALHAELKNTRQALVESERGVTLPESREFYWSKIQREIDKVEVVQPLQPEPTLWQLVSRLLKPVSAVAVIVLFAMIAFNGTSGRSSGADVLVASSDMDAITFRDDSDDTTYVWFAETPENDVANSGDNTTLN
mgnify:CR=1 FL=1